MVKNPLAKADVRDADLIPRSERSPEGGHGNPPNILAWRIPWTEEPGGSMGSQTVGHDLVTKPQGREISTLGDHTTEVI